MIRVPFKNLDRSIEARPVQKYQGHFPPQWNVAVYPKFVPFVWENDVPVLKDLYFTHRSFDLNWYVCSEGVHRPFYIERK